MDTRKTTILFRLALTSILCTSLFVSCREDKELDDKTRTALIEKGKQISASLSGALLTKLSSEIQANGTVEAIKYCSVNALPLTDSIAKLEKVKISRVSHKNRNPANAANEEEMALIKNYIAQIEKGAATAPVITTGKGKYTYYAPVVIAMPTCLKCHGKPDTDIDAEVLNALKTLYPEDQATGFAMGELRGLFKIEFDDKR